MLRPGARVGVAVSGGADSVCLLHVLQQLGVAVTAVHLNHKLRGAESDADAEFVSQLAAQLSIASIVESADVAAMPGNLEQAGRYARLGLFRRLLTSGTLDKIATAHTLSDQAETVLYRLIRGSGTAGLAGIRPVTVDGLIRPMLDVDRPEIIAYLEAHSLSWRVDSTNTDPRFARNRIRHELLPLIARDHNSAIFATLAQVADTARDEEDWWSLEVQRIAASFGDFPELNIQQLHALHPAARRRLIRYAMRIVRGDLRGIDASHVEAIVALTTREQGTGSVFLPGNLTAVRSFDRIRFVECEAAADFEVPLQPPAVVHLPDSSIGLRFQIIEIASTSASPVAESGYNGNDDSLDADRLSGPLVVRNWRPGDMLHRPGHLDRKMKSLFQRARIPIWERRSWPVLACGANIAWARRFGVAAGYRPTNETRRIIVVSEVEGGQVESNWRGSAS